MPGFNIIIQAEYTKTVPGGKVCRGPLRSPAGGAPGKALSSWSRCLVAKVGLVHDPLGEHLTIDLKLKELQNKRQNMIPSYPESKCCRLCIQARLAWVEKRVMNVPKKKNLWKPKEIV